MKKVYNNQEEISQELRKLRLKRDISIEELKLVKEQVKDDLSVGEWAQSALITIGKLGLYNFVKRLL